MVKYNYVIIGYAPIGNVLFPFSASMYRHSLPIAHEENCVHTLQLASLVQLGQKEVL